MNMTMYGLHKKRCHGAVGGVWSRLTLLLLILLALAGVPCCDGKVYLPDCKTKSSSKYDVLYCWLSKRFQVNLPSKSFSELFFTVEVSDLVCKDWKITSLKSSILEEDNGVSAIDMKFPKDLEFVCVGSYHVHPIWVSGDVSVTISQGLNELVMDVWPSEKLGTISKCDANSLQVSSLSFSGSISAWLLDWFHSTFANDVTSDLHSMLCPQIQTNLPPLIQQQLISPLSNYLHQLIHNATAHPSNNSSHVQPDSITWTKDLPKFANLLQQLQQHYLIQPFLHQGFLLKFLKDQFHYTPKSDEDCGYFYHGFQGNWLPQLIFEYILPTTSTSTSDISGKANILVSHTGELQNFTLFQPYTSQSMNVLTMNYPNGMNIAIDNISLSSLLFDDEENGIPSFSINLDLKDLDISKVIMSFSNWNRRLFDTLTLGDVMDNPFETVLSHLKIEDIDVTAIVSKLTVQTPNNYDSRYLLEHDLDELVNHVLQIYIKHESPAITKIVWAILQGPLRSYINHYYLQPQPPPTLLQRNNERQNEQGQNRLKFSFPNMRSFEQSLKCRWKILQPFLNHYFEQNILSQLPHSQASLSSSSILNGWHLSSLEFPELGSIDSLEIFDRVDTHHFESELKMSYQCPNNNNYVNENNNFNVKIANCHGNKNKKTDDNMDVFTIMVALKNSKTKDTLQVSLLLEDVLIFMGNAFDYKWDMWRKLNVHNVLESPFFQMLLQPMQNAGIYGLSRNQIGNVQLRLDYYNYETNETTTSISSPSVHGNNDELDGIWSIFTHIVQDVINGYLKINLFQFYSEDTSSYSSINAENNKNHTSTVPPHDRNYENTQTILIIVVSCTIGVANILAVLFLFFFKKKTDDNEESTVIEADDVSEDSLEQEKEYQPPPRNLMFHEKTYSLIRYLVPVLIVFTIFLFIVSNLAKGAELGIGVHIPGHKMIGPFNFFEFTLVKTLKKMWKVHIYLLFFIIFIFSLVWPYVKLILMMVAWVVPERFFGLNRREDLLFWLDALGKLSLVDIFALVVFMAIFRFEIPLPTGDVVATYVNPQFGFHCFLYATVMSLIIGHCATFVHRQSVRPTFEGNYHRLSSLRNHRFKGRVDGAYMKLSKFFQGLLTILLIADVVMLSLSIFRKVFVVKVGGLPGVLMGFPLNTKMESIWSFGTAIPQSVSDVNVSIRIIQVVFFFFAVFMPYASIAVVAVIFFVPVSIQALQRIYSIAEICNAWSAIEVFLLASLVSILQIGKLVEGIRNGNCKAFENQMKKWHFQKLIGTTKCIDVSSSMTSEAVLLYVAVGIHILLIYFFLKISHRALYDRLEREGTFKKNNQFTHQVESNGFFMWFAQTWLGKILFTDCDDNNPEVEETTTPP